MHGIDVSIPAARAHADGDMGWIGIRPEKVLIGEPGEALDAPGNTIPGGVVTDVSFVGVSTQYLVRMPWGQELQVFEQNTGRRRLFRTGEQVELSWRPEYAFLLDHAQDASAGAQKADDVVTRRRGLPIGYLLLLPAALWLVLFFVIPFYSLVATSLYDPSGSDFRGYEMTYHCAELHRRASRTTGSRCCARSGTARSRRSSAWSSATCWPTRSRSRPAAGRT